MCCTGTDLTQSPEDVRHGESTGIHADKIRDRVLVEIIKLVVRMLQNEEI